MKLFPINPEPGTVYISSRGGRFVCLRVLDSYQHNAVLQNALSGYTFIAHHIKRREDNSIEWEYSSQGHFLKEGKK